MGWGSSGAEGGLVLGSVTQSTVLGPAGQVPGDLPDTQNLRLHSRLTESEFVF